MGALHLALLDGAAGLSLNSSDELALSNSLAEIGADHSLAGAASSVACALGGVEYAGIGAALQHLQ